MPALAARRAFSLGAGDCVQSVNWMGGMTCLDKGHGRTEEYLGLSKCYGRIYGGEGLGHPVRGIPVGDGVRSHNRSVGRGWVAGEGRRLFLQASIQGGVCHIAPERTVQQPPLGHFSGEAGGIPASHSGQAIGRLASQRSASVRGMSVRRPHLRAFNLPVFISS